MSGTVAGGRKAREKNLANDPDFYRKIGSLGGRKKGIKKGFALNPELARKAGAKGGKISRRTGVSTGQGEKKEYFYNGSSDDFFHTKPMKEYLHPTESEPEPKKRSFIQRVFGGR